MRARKASIQTAATKVTNMLYLASGVRLLRSLTNQKFSYFLLIFTKLCGKLLPDGANDNYRCHLMKRNC